MAEEKFLTQALQAVDETRSSMALMDALALLRNPKSSAADVARAIEFDPPTADQILVEVNSPFYALENKVTTLTHAVTLLGFERVKFLLQTQTKQEMYKNVEATYSELQTFKRHNLAVACFAEQIAIHFKYSNPREFFEGGMMHDIGKYFYILKFPHEFKKLEKEALETGRPFYEVEQERTGTDHAQIGVMMAEAWNLPEPIRYVIRFHHQVTERDLLGLTSREQVLVEVVTFANLMGQNVGHKKGGRVPFEKLPAPPGLMSKEDYNRICTQAEQQFKDEAKAMGLLTG